MTVLGTASVSGSCHALSSQAAPATFQSLSWANTSVLEKSVVKGDLAANSAQDTLTNSASL